MFIVFASQLKLSFADACQNDCQIASSTLVSGPQNRKPYNKHSKTIKAGLLKHLNGLVFSACTVNFWFSFFPSIYAPRASRLRHKSIEKSYFRNLQYGPKTRLIRGKYTSIFAHIFELMDQVTSIFCFQNSSLTAFLKRPLNQSGQICSGLLSRGFVAVGTELRIPNP